MPNQYTRKPGFVWPPRKRKDAVVRFFESVNKDGPIPKSISFPDLKTSCWIWEGSTTTQGYGRFWVDGKHVGAHIYSYILVKGAIPDGLELDHCCRVTTCVRPDHLEAVTPLVNNHRSTSAETTRARRAAINYCRRGHEFTPENTLRKSNGGRLCRTCKNNINKAFMREFHKRKKG